MARKKIVFVLVEGPSEQEALSVILNRIFDNETVYVHIMYCDITTQSGVTPLNILSKIGDEIRGYAASNHYKKADFKEIIHLVDTDGAYIPDANVIQDDSADKPIYYLTDIRTKNKVAIERRNKQKRDNVNRVCGVKEIWGVPYSVYYMSCNLDHVLYNKQNSSDEEKESDSYNFARAFKDKIYEFISFITESDFSVMNGYTESWDYIKQDLHSLERHTNFGLCFEKLETTDD
ncbi:MAG: hypothetical protein IJB57_00795 [Clostridia bacterium]|nr:hypothetical protein [Clostridia bacterium]